MRKFLLLAAILALAVAIIPSYVGPMLVSSSQNEISDIPKCVEKILGIGKDCPFQVSRSDRVVLIAIDAFGWHTWEYAKSVSESIDITENIDEIAKQGEVRMLKTTYPSTTRVAFPVMLPDEFFGLIVSSNKTYACVGSEGFFNFTGICPERVNVSNMDRDRYIADDDDKALTAIEMLNGGYDFIFVHLSVDSTCHKFGPYDDKSIDDLQKTDSLAGDIYDEMLERPEYSGATLIVTADHGCHPTADGGDHGSKRPEDMDIPLIITRLP